MLSLICYLWVYLRKTDYRLMHLKKTILIWHQETCLVSLQELSIDICQGRSDGLAGYCEKLLVGVYYIKIVLH